MSECTPEPRFKKHVPCGITQGEHSYTGVVLNVYKMGLFVKTKAVLKKGNRVDLYFYTLKFAVIAVVAWTKEVPRELRQVAENGFGLRILKAADAYYDLVAEAGRASLSRGPRARSSEEETPTDDAPEETATRDQQEEPDFPASRFRVRVKQDGRPRSRMIKVAAASEEDAAREALVKTGDGWSIIEVKRL